MTLKVRRAQGFWNNKTKHKTVNIQDMYASNRTLVFLKLVFYFKRK